MKRYTDEKTDMRKPTAAILLLLAALCIGKCISAMVLPLKDTVSVRAEDADEICLDSYTVDGAEYKVSRLTSGKWMSLGDDSFLWRTESDSRQPAGCTREISFQMPVGKARSLRFVTSLQGGSVSVDTPAGHTEGNTYSEDAGTANITIDGSTGGRLAVNLLLYGAIYVIMLLLGAGAYFWFVKHMDRCCTFLTAFLKAHWQTVCLAAIALLGLKYMHWSVMNESLWCDELIMVDCVSFPKLSQAITMDVSCPPLYVTLMWIWYHIVPYGENWLLLPSELFTVAAVFVVGMTAKRYFGFMQSVIVQVFALLSFVVVGQCGHEFRNYSLIFLLSAIAIYFYLDYARTAREISRKDMIGYAVVLALMAYTHYYGLFMIVPMFLYDCILFVRDHSRKKFIIPYVAAGILYVPWIIYMLAYNSDIVSVWQGIPTPETIISLIKYLCGQIDLVYYLFLFGAALAAAAFVRKCVKKDQEDEGEQAVGFPLVFILVGLIAGMYFYATKLAFKSTFWMDRYFVCLLPCVYLLFADGFVKSIDVLCGERFGKYRTALAVTVCFCVLNPVYFGTKVMHSHYQDYRAAAAYIYSEPDYIYNDDTLVYASEQGNAWNEYYLTRQGTRDAVQLITAVPDEGTLLRYNRVYVNYNHTPVPEEMQAMLDAHYELLAEDSGCNIRVYIK